LAIIKVKIISMIGQLSELDSVTAICGKSHLFHPDNAMNFYSNTESFLPLSEDNPYQAPLQQLSSSIKSIGQPLHLFSEEETEKKQLKPVQALHYAQAISNRIAKLQAQHEKISKEVQHHEQDARDASHFVGLSVDLKKIRVCQFISIHFGSLPRAGYEQLKTYEDNPFVVFFPCTSDEKTVWGVYICPLEQCSEIDRIFSRLYFQPLDLERFDGTPKEAVGQFKKEADTSRNELKKVDDEIQQLWKDEQERCNLIYSWLTIKNTYFGIRKYAFQYNGFFILSGWIPQEAENSFTSKLDQCSSVEYNLDDASNELVHSPPVKLHNRRPFKSFEYFTEMYGLPNYSEIDPTPLLACIFVTLFGIMFGDVGHGICAFLLGLWMWKKKNMPLGHILMPCGISSCIFGSVFGSVFGFEHLLDPLYYALGFSEKPISVMEGSTTTNILIVAVSIGVVLLIVAMFLNIISSLRQRHYERALFGQNGVAGLIFYISIVFGFVLQLLGTPVMTPLYVTLLIVLPLLVMFFREVFGGLMEHKPDWKPEKWGEFIVQNFFELFEFLLSYLSNTVSFLRVGAFVLVHAGMMNMVFTLADMVGGVGYPIVLVIGNIFVMALEGLLVSIHVLRLNFYEMFSRFYDGDGRPFTPVEVRVPS